jgi:hypothetical protein
MTQHMGERGEKLGEEDGQTMGFRILTDERQGFSVEASERAEGTFLGENSTNIRTYRMSMKPDGTLDGSGQGIMMLKDGSMAMWTGTGTGKPKGPGLGAATWQVQITIRQGTGKWAAYANKTLSGEYSTDDNWRSKGVLFAPK